MQTDAVATPPAATQGPPPHAQVIRMATAYWVSRAVYVAARLGIADHLKDGSRDAEQLAAATGTHAPTLRRVLRALASVGLFRTDEQGRFALTPLGAALQSDAPGAARSTVIALARDWIWPAWGEILHCLRTGQTGVEKAHGLAVFDLLARDPEEASHFNAAMIGFHGDQPPAVAEAYDFAGVGTLIDVGGGSGNLLITVLKANPELQGMLYDLPHVAAEAEQNVAAAGLADRCAAVGGDFFAAVPDGGDAYLLKFVLHDWDDERCRVILRQCRRAIPDHGKLLVVELVLPPGEEPFFGKWLDLHMLVLLGGRERTASEYDTIFRAARFKLNRVVPTPPGPSVVEAVPV